MGIVHSTSRGVATDGRFLYPAMPYASFAKISDDDVKALHGSQSAFEFGKRPAADPGLAIGHDVGAAVSSDAVAALRATTAPKSTAPAGFVTPRLADLLSRLDAAQLIHGGRLMSETKSPLAQNVGDQMRCSSCHLDAGTIAHAAPLVGLAQIFPLYNARGTRHHAQAADQRLL